MLCMLDVPAGISRLAMLADVPSMLSMPASMLSGLWLGCLLAVEVGIFDSVFSSFGVECTFSEYTI